MTGCILDQISYVTCPHTTGIAKPDQCDTHVTVSGQPIMTVARMYSIAGCPQNTPCSKAMWIKGSTRVTASGLPVAIDDGQSMVIPGGSLKSLMFQRRVQAK
jgi:hypothetical protein